MHLPNDHFGKLESNVFRPPTQLDSRPPHISDHRWCSLVLAANVAGKRPGNPWEGSVVIGWWECNYNALCALGG